MERALGDTCCRRVKFLTIRFVAVLFILWAAAALVPAASFAQTSEKLATTATTSPEDQELKEKYLQEFLRETQDLSFVYKKEGRIDPFVPFVTEVVVKAELEEAAEELTGLRKFEPGQLTLVGILLTSDNNPMAMVQDQTGRGYTIQRATRLGKFGVVEEIVQNKVIITETRTTHSNAKQVKTIEMILKKEGEK